MKPGYISKRRVIFLKITGAETLSIIRDKLDLSRTFQGESICKLHLPNNCKDINAKVAKINQRTERLPHVLCGYIFSGNNEGL